MNSSPNNSSSSSSRRTLPIALITGANKGIGFETARRLAMSSFTVLVGARDQKRGEEAVEKLRSLTEKGRATSSSAATATSRSHIHLVEIDVSNDASVKNAARNIESDFGRLDVLVNNAGIAVGCSSASEQDVSAMRTLFETNVFGVVATTQAMLPLLRRAPAARIVNVASSLGSLALVANRESPQALQAGFFAYSCSKTALNHFTIRLANELFAEAPNLKINSACPGYVATDLNGHRGVRTVAQGAEIIVRLATLPNDGPTGGLFNEDGPLPW